VSITTDRDDPRLKAIRPDGMQEAYLALSEEERRKGFVRPVRESYTHVGIRPKHPTRELTAEERERYDRFGYLLYEEYPSDPESSSLGRFWTAKTLDSGCGRSTRMARELAETYARQTTFFVGTFCSTCRAHFPLEEFVWDGTDQTVGS
jgi:hypothetical protein